MASIYVGIHGDGSMKCGICELVNFILVDLKGVVLVSYLESEMELICGSSIITMYARSRKLV